MAAETAVPVKIDAETGAAHQGERARRFDESDPGGAPRRNVHLWKPLRPGRPIVSGGWLPPVRSTGPPVDGVLTKTA